MGSIGVISGTLTVTIAPFLLMLPSISYQWFEIRVEFTTTEYPERAQCIRITELPCELDTFVVCYRITLTNADVIN